MPDKLSQLIQTLHLTSLDNNPNLYFIQKHLGVKPSSLLVAFSIFIIIVTLTSNTSTTIIALTCTLIPGYFTFLALQSEQKQDNIKYLTYWIIFALLQTISPLISLILPSTFYILFRIGMTIALLHPETNLTIKIYYEYIEPEIKKYQKNIDKYMENGIEKGKNVVNQQINNGFKKFQRK